MGFSCKSRSAIAVCNSDRRNNGTVLESFKFRDLEAATNWFAQENLILKTSHGHLYRGILSDGRLVAVKRPDTTPDAAEAFHNEVQILSKLFSRRLVNLLGCSCDGRVKLLVLEYMDNGPLHETLTESAVSLSWPMRVKVAVDIAKAIRALHASSPPIVHRNIRSTNIFLDRDGNARLSDFCLAKVVVPESDPPRRSVLIPIPEVEDYNYAPRLSSVGLDDYFDQEDTMSSESSDMISLKIDVFDMGIILLGIMSGRSASRDPSARGLLAWALPLIKHGHSMAICDPRITPFPDSAAVRILANMAARCVRSSSARRPAMDEVVQCLTKASQLVPEPLWTGTTTGSISTTPELTPTTTESRSMSHRKEKLINSNLDAGHTPFNAATRSAFPSLKKKRSSLVFRLGRFLARKLKIGASRRGSSYDRLPKKKKPASSRDGAYLKSSPLKGAKVADDQELGDPEKKSSRSLDTGSMSRAAANSGNNASRLAGHYNYDFSSGTYNHRSGKKFLRL